MYKVKARALLNLLFILLISSSAAAQGKDISVLLDWNSSANPDQKNTTDITLQWFNGAYAATDQPERPQYGGIVRTSTDAQALKLELRNPIYEQIEVPAWMDITQLGFKPTLNWENAVMRKQQYIRYAIDPYRKRADGGVERLLSASVNLQANGRAKAQMQTIEFTDHSKLATGTWFRMSIPRDGVYRLNRSYFESLGIDVASLDPSTINIYGNDTGQLGYVNDEYDSDDLQIKAIQFVGGNDGSFDSGDYILFYSKGPHRWDYDASIDEFKHLKHANMTVAYNFIGIGVDPASRLSDAQPAAGVPNQTVSSFDELRFYERDLESVIKSGRRLVGEKFGIDRTLDFGGATFNIENISNTEPTKIRLRAVGEAIGSSNISQVTFECQDNEAVLNLPGWAVIYVPMSSREGLITFLPENGDLSVQTDFAPAGSDSQAWIDFISINARRNLVKTNSQYTFRDKTSFGAGNVSRFEISNMSAAQMVWDVTESRSPTVIQLELTGDIASFSSNTTDLREFVLFDLNNTLSPSGSTSVANQDLHSTGQHDMVILTAVPFRSTAEKFADFHRAEGLDVQVIEPQTIYNEFSCGMTDVTAIKIYMKMLYDRAGTDVDAMPDYLMLIGDGNYNQSDINPLSSIYIPSYQSAETNSLTRSYVADDYFGLLDDGESEGGGSVDIGIGRLPVRSIEEVEDIYNKVVRYRNDNTGVVGGQCNGDAQTTYGDWRNKIVLVADDEDGVTHMSQADDLGDIIAEVDEDYIVDKIFLDAYLQDITPGGARYPQATDELRRSLEKGMFIVSYTGHGGEVGWAAERVLDVPTIQNLSNNYSLPLMLTATCEFSRFDDPGRTSAGEFTLLNPTGGVIGLFTTTRLVYSNPNYQLSKNFFDIVLRKDITSYSCEQPGGGSIDFEFPLGLRLGDIIRVSKNCTPTSYVDKANFSLLGDPALKLTYPELQVVTDSITDLAGNPIDTLKALQRVKFFGHVERDGAVATDFNGEIEPTVYDKEATIQTLSNDNGPAFTFSLRDNIFYKGRSSVSNGSFQFEFIVPKDISYQEGNGKVFYYGVADNTDAQGSNDQFAVGGTAANAEDDTAPPTISLFLDSESFVEGGITNESPVLIANIFDEFGINTVGNGIGHDITAILDGDVSSPFVLNDYFELDLDSYQKGRVRFEFKDLAEGEHTLRFKVWDIYNNSAVKEINFNVELQSELSLDNVVNYPNPFTTRTEFLFEHNQACEALNVQVQVFTVSGKLVKTLETDVDAHKALRNQIVWDGKDDYGDKLGRGVYVYKLKVTTPEGIKQEVFEKLVLL